METNIEKGKEFVSKYNDVSVNQLLSSTWKTRKKSNLIKILMKKGNISIDDLASLIGCSKHYLNNKLNRDSFSFEDILVAAYVCGFSVCLTNKRTKKTEEIDVKDFIENNTNYSWDQISSFSSEQQLKIRKEYEQKKADLERMKEEYGFQD